VSLGTIYSMQLTATHRRAISDGRRRGIQARKAQAYRLKQLHGKMLMLLGTCELILREKLDAGDDDPLARYTLARIDDLSVELQAEAIGATTLLQTSR
jgi:hypothetical protein